MYEWLVEAGAVRPAVDDVASEPIEWSTRVRYTRGGVVDVDLDGGLLRVDWVAPLLGSPEGELVIAVSDGEGGVAAAIATLPDTR